MLRNRLSQTTPFQMPGDLLSPELIPADGISIEPDDLVIFAAPGALYPRYGQIIHLHPTCPYAQLRTWTGSVYDAKVDELKLWLKAGACVGEDVQSLLKNAALAAIAASA